MEILDNNDIIGINDTIRLQSKRFWLDYLQSNTTCFYPKDFKSYTEIKEGESDSSSSDLKNKYSTKEFCLTEELTSGFNKICNNSEARMLVVLTSSISILFHKCLQVSDVAINIPVFKQLDNSELTNAFLPFISSIDNEVTFRGYLNEVKGLIVELNKHQSFDYSIIDEQDNSIYQDLKQGFSNIGFVFKNVHKCNYKEDPGSLPAELNFVFEYKNNELSCSIVYSSNFTEKSACILVNRYKELLSQVLKNTDALIKEVNILSKEEELELNSFNNNEADFPHEKSFIHYLEENAKKYTDKIALVYENASFSYGLLNQKVNQIARYLKGEGISNGMIVGILLDRGVEMKLCILAIWKLGAIYLPLDKKYPVDRLKSIINDSGLEYIVSTAAISNSRKDGLDCNVIITDDIIDKSEHFDNRNLDHPFNKNEVSYIIFTSGSTGNPKGVVVEHIGMMNHLESKVNDLDIDENSIIVQNANHTFDISIWQLFVGMLRGAKTIIYPNNDILNTEKFIKNIQNQGVTILEVVPSYLRVMLDVLQNKNTEFKSLAYLIVTGEEVKPNLINDWYNLYPGIFVVNAYGPTEASDDITMFKIPIDIKYESIPIGKPVQNFNIQIVGEQNELLPIGVKGEICVSGIGVGRGYLNDVAKTAKAFSACIVKGEKTRMYRTGDIGCWQNDGIIKFFGRKDYQVKIRGFRIELSEIENHLIQLPQVNSVVVNDFENSDNKKQLCAYLVLNENIEVNFIREYLLNAVPEYMVPSYFVEMQTFPLTANGKIERKALPDPVLVDEELSTKQYLVDNSIGHDLINDEPLSDTEAQVRLLFGELLSIEPERLRRNSNFFEIGGDSLTLIPLVSLIYKTFNKKIPVDKAFELPTIAELAELIDSAETQNFNALTKAEKKEHYALSASQNRLYVLSKLDEDSTAYNMHQILEVDGEFDIEKYKNIFGTLINRHEGLRTAIIEIDGEPRQLICEKVQFNIPFVKLSTEEAKNRIENFVKPFDLSKPPFIRTEVIQVAGDKYYLLIDKHHIISDRVSENLFIEELLSLYKGEQLGEIKYSYKDYSDWQLKSLNADDSKIEEEYWHSIFSDELPTLDLPTDYNRPMVQNNDGGVHNFSLNPDQHIALKKIARNEGMTSFMMYLSIYYVWLHRLTGQADLIIGSPAAGRSHANIDNIMGVFINSLALRAFPSGNKTIKSFLYEVKDSVQKAISNQDYQFEDLVDTLNIKRDLSRNPLFDVMITYQLTDNYNENGISLDLGDLKLKSYHTEQVAAKFDFDLIINETDKNTFFSLVYAKSLFKQKTIERFSEYFLNIVNAFITNIDQKINRFQITNNIEHKQLLSVNNRLNNSQRHNQSVLELFEANVDHTPNNIAVQYKNIQCSYACINEKANKVAHSILKVTNGKKELVGIYCERSIDFLIGILGVFKANCAYLPIETDYPENRIQSVLDESNTKIVLIGQQNQEIIQEVSKTLTQNLCLIEFESVYADGQINSANPGIKLLLNDLAYVIYTSGSTGKPKGVMVHHGGMINHIYAKINDLDLSKYDVLAQTASVCFDISVWQFLTMAVLGGKNLIINKEYVLSPSNLLSLIQKNHITVLESVPSLINTFIDFVNENRNNTLQSLRWMILTGEAITMPLVRKWFGTYQDIKIMNAYGPTEASDDITHYVFDKEPEQGEQLVSIGKAIENSQVYVLDPAYNICPVGVRGEICVSGICVGKGYLNNEEKTNQAFVVNPFSNGSGENEILYKTGDIGYVQEDGNIICLGRLDHQVKIRGNRIELGEIEKQILEFEGVEEAVVIVIEDNNDKFLCAYYVSGNEIQTQLLKDFLKESLPDYMVPAYFVHMEAMPLLTSGKINRKSLPKPEITLVHNEYIAPANEVEVELARIWSDILYISQELISAESDFFELGGHSLKAVQLLTIIKKQFKTDISLQKVFLHPTLRSLSDFIIKESKNRFNSILPVEKKEYYELSSAQRRLYAIYQQEPGRSYNIIDTAIIEGNIDTEVFTEALNTIVSRHEILRTSFHVINNELVQKVHENVPFALETYEVSSSDQLNSCIENIIKDPFDLEVPKLFKIGVIKENDAKYTVVINMHHIITDAFSVEILFSNLANLYKGNKLQALNLQYKDYAYWQKSKLQSDELRQQEEYWKQVFSDPISELNMPFDFKRQDIESSQGAFIFEELSFEQSSQIGAICHKYNTTPYVFFLASLSILMHKYCSQNDILVGTPTSGRSHNDVNELIGFFVNLTPMRNFINPEDSFDQALLKVQASTIKSLENSDYQFDDLIRTLNLGNHTKKNQLFDLIFNYTENPYAILQQFPFDIKPGVFTDKFVPFNLEINVTKIKSEFIVTFGYSTDLFKKETVEKMFNSYASILEEILVNPNIIIKEITLAHSLSTIDNNEHREIEVEFDF